MIQKDILIDKIVEFINSKLSILSKESQLINIFVKPFLARGINNNLSKLDKFLSFVADDNGMIDVEGILNDMIDNLIISPVKEEYGVRFGDGSIQMNIPFINKAISFDKEDIEEFKQNLNQIKK